MDDRWMGKALDLASEALARGEFPVGCVLVCGGEIAAVGARVHTRAGEANELDHAEMNALRRWVEAGRPGYEEGAGGAAVYCTLEPCLMCLGAMILNGVRRIVYAYEDVMGGAAGLDRSRPLSAGGPRGFSRPLYAPQGLEIVGGVRRAESLALFQTFFSDPANAYWRDSPLCAYTLDADGGR